MVMGRKRAGVGSSLRLALRGAIEHFDWKIIAATVALSIAVDAYNMMSLSSAKDAVWLFPFGPGTNVPIGLGIMFATLLADQFVARGAKRVPAYGVAVLVGSAVGAFAQWPVHHWLQTNSLQNIRFPFQTAIAFFEYLFWGSIIVWVYVNRRSAMIAAARLTAAQVKRMEIQRISLESRLQALQARVEPQFLFDSLTRVHDLYERDPANGAQVMGDLIAYLRAALPHLREPASTLPREVDLAIAYLNVMRAQFGERLVCSVDVSDVPSGVRMPAMVLLPLINHALTAAPPAGRDVIRIGARHAKGTLRLEIVHSGQAFAFASGSDDVQDIEQRLQGLYGEEWNLRFEPSPDKGTQAVVEIPYETTDSSHR